MARTFGEAVDRCGSICSSIVICIIYAYDGPWGYWIEETSVISSMCTLIGLSKQYVLRCPLFPRTNVVASVKRAPEFERLAGPGEQIDSLRLIGLD